jgi:hypothetical protein
MFYLRETYRFDRDLELAVGEVSVRAQLRYYGFHIPHNFRGGTWSGYIAYRTSPGFVPTKINKALISRGRRNLLPSRMGWNASGNDACSEPSKGCGCARFPFQPALSIRTALT